MDHSNLLWGSVQIVLADKSKNDSYANKFLATNMVVNFGANKFKFITGIFLCSKIL